MTECDIIFASKILNFYKIILKFNFYFVLVVCLFVLTPYFTTLARVYINLNDIGSKMCTPEQVSNFCIGYLDLTRTAIN